jgi:hypothetical protein
MVEGLQTPGFNGVKGSIRAIIGGRNFTPADIDSAEVPFFTPASGVGGRPLLHDGGVWPGTGGNTDNDDGRATFGVDQAGEIYDLDGNSHYPKAVLRYIGTHCYIFVPVMYFPTLPKGISATEETTLAAKSEWGMYWPDTAGMGTGLYYYAAATGSKTLEPRFVLGSDKNLARLKLKELADEFDGNIYAKVREYFGSEPDIDGDPKIYILLDDIRDGYGSFRGYVWKANQLPNSVYSQSNEKEIVHLDLFPTFLLNPQQGYRTMAHEFTHLICFNEGDTVTGGDIDQEETWLEEGFTQYASYVYDKSHTSNVDEFIKKPDTPLTGWNDAVPFANYGASYLWIFYLMEQYGKTNPQTFMRGMVRDKTKGIESLGNALRPFNTTFADVFADWVVANILDKTKKMDGSLLNDGKWGYYIDNDFDTTNNMGVNEALPMKYSERVILGPLGAARSSQVHSWAADYIEMSGNTGNINIGFDGDDRTTFRAGIIKRGPQIDPSVEFVYLNERQAGNLIIQNYGAGNAYETLVLVPIAMDSGYAEFSYVYSATFSDLKVGMFPNPVFENELHIVLRTNDTFAATPRLQMTFADEQGYLTMTPVNDSTYLTNYRIKTSGEGLVEAYGTTTNGTILSNKLKFSAVYYPPRSSGLLTASFGSLSVPENAFNKGGMFLLAAQNLRVSYPGLLCYSEPVDVSLPSAKSEKPLTLTLPIKVADREKRLGLFDVSVQPPAFLARVDVGETMVTANITSGGSVVVAEDLNAPEIASEPEDHGEDGLVIRVKDSGAGVDPASLLVTANGLKIPARFDEKTGSVRIDTTRMKTGQYDLGIAVADRLGNQAQAAIRTQVAGALSLKDSVVYPSPARAFVKFRCTFQGAAAAAMFVEAVVHDASGEEVFSTPLRHLGSGVYEAKWDLRNENGRNAANGAYFVKLDIQGGGQEIKKRLKFAILR